MCYPMDAPGSRSTLAAASIARTSRMVAPVHEIVEESAASGKASGAISAFALGVAETSRS